MWRNQEGEDTLVKNQLQQRTTTKHSFRHDSAHFVRHQNDLILQIIVIDLDPSGVVGGGFGAAGTAVSFSG